jgi:hypothetical protein
MLHKDSTPPPQRQTDAPKRAASPAAEPRGPRRPRRPQGEPAGSIPPLPVGPHASGRQSVSTPRVKALQARRRALGLCCQCGEPSRGFWRCLGCRLKESRRLQALKVGQ